MKKKHYQQSKTKKIMIINYGKNSITVTDMVLNDISITLTCFKFKKKKMCRSQKFEN